MNKNRYRIVFNTARGLAMAVPETASGHQSESGTSAVAASGLPPEPVLAALRPLALSLIAALGLLTITPAAQAQIIVDASAPAAQQPVLTNAANGVPVVNIQTPSAAGVSRNSYTRFDVERQGAILNNARTNAQTQLGGWIQGNPHLAGGTARILLNEVNSANPSQLLGYIEVGGDRAQVVVANPAGVTCDGCGFINASRATLTTGTPILNDGSLEGYRVQRGLVTVQGAGLDASQTDYTDLIARAVLVNAGIWAKQLGVTAGANEVNTANTRATPIAGSGAAPLVSIDVAALGGMYANKIVLVGTEAGVGVNNAGQIGAAAGDVVVTADGRLTNGGLINGAANIQTATRGLANTGVLYAQQHTAIDSNGSIVNSGTLAAGGDLVIDTTAQLDNRGGLIGAGGALGVQAASLDNRNTQGPNQGIQAQSVNLAAGQIDNAAGSIGADTALVITGTGSLDNAQGRVSSGGTLEVRDPGAGRTLAIANTGGTFIAGQNLQIDAASLAGDGSLLSLGDLAVALSGNTTHTGEITANGNATFATGGTLDNQGSMQAGNALNVSAADISNAAGGEFGAQTTTVSASGQLVNRGLIDGVDTHVNAVTLSNTGSGRIFGDHLAIAAATLNNTAESGSAPVLAARSRLDIGAQALGNRDHALIFSAGDLAIGGALDGNKHATGQALLVTNRGATIEALGNLTIAAVQIDNLNADLVTQQVNDPSTYREFVQPRNHPTQYPVSVCSGIGGSQDKNYCAGYPGSFEDYTWYKVTSTPSHTEVVSTQPGKILAGGDIQLTGSLTNQDSHIVAGGLLDVSGASVQNLATQGQDITVHSGTAQFTEVVSCGTFGDKHCRKWYGVAAYNPAPDYGSPYNLPTTRLAQNTAPTGSGTSLAAAGGAAAVAAPAAAALPNNALFQPNPNPNSSYLIETDPRFANYRTWLSSDYMLAQLKLDPVYMHKRLGDGFYEQRLIRDQILELTGRRFLDDHANDEAQYQALMNAGLTYANECIATSGSGLAFCLYGI